MYIIGYCYSYYINFGVYRRQFIFLFFTRHTKRHTLWPINSKYSKCILLLLNYFNLYEINVRYIAFIMYVHHWKLYAQHLQFFYSKTLNYFTHYVLFVLNIEFLDDSNLFKCLIAVRNSESRVETLQIFREINFSEKNSFQK